MTNIELQYYPYELKMLKPFETSKGPIVSRKGYLVKLKNSKGITAAGDIAPFPDYGSETYEKAGDFLKNFKFKLDLDLNDFEFTFQKNFNFMTEYPSVSCGIEQALLNLISKEKNLSLNYLLNQPSLPEIKVNALIGLVDADEAARLTEVFIDEGYSTIKIKAGRQNFRDDKKCIAKIRSTAHDNIKLRVDVNGKWKLPEAERNLKELEEFSIEYVEQPVNSINDFLRLKEKTNIPLAPDESVRSLKDAAEFINCGAVQYLVLKPMMIGGISPVLSIYEEAKKKNVKIVISSSFESNIGYAYVVFAASLIEEETAHGLATQGIFETKFLPEFHTIKNGTIHL
jgi:L-Ala-D/L-Glu epimerase